MLASRHRSRAIQRSPQRCTSNQTRTAPRSLPRPAAVSAFLRLPPPASLFNNLRYYSHQHDNRHTKSPETNEQRYSPHTNNQRPVGTSPILSRPKDTSVESVLARKPAYPAPLTTEAVLKHETQHSAEHETQHSAKQEHHSGGLSGAKHQVSHRMREKIFVKTAEKAVSNILPRLIKRAGKRVGARLIITRLGRGLTIAIPAIGGIAALMVTVVDWRRSRLEAAKKNTPAKLAFGTAAFFDVGDFLAHLFTAAGLAGLLDTVFHNAHHLEHYVHMSETISLGVAVGATAAAIVGEFVSLKEIVEEFKHDLAEQKHEIEEEVIKEEEERLQKLETEKEEQLQEQRKEQREKEKDGSKIEGVGSKRD